MKSLIFIIAVVMTSSSFGNCNVLDSQGGTVKNLGDALYMSLTGEAVCPKNVIELKQMLSDDGLIQEPAMVANRGHNNPKFGSFSFFESVSGSSMKFTQTVNEGDFFFGHFTTLKKGFVELDQAPRAGKLMIELIAWDYDKGYFNFYELLGASGGSQWFYRGDSKDIYFDNKNLKKQINQNNPKFGKTLRCSACHISGGPIMKELKLPHNDWWTSTKKLKLEPNLASIDVDNLTKEVLDAESFAKAVKKGIAKLNFSSSFKSVKSNLSLQEQLRPLFCTTEINLISGNSLAGTPTGDFEVSSDYWVSSFLTNKKVKVSKNLYFSILQSLGMRFPETNLIDAENPWLAPVKGYSNLQAIKMLISGNVISREFAADVLAVDYKKPLFSKTRCDLLKLVSQTQSNWMGQFKINLSKSTISGANQLLVHLNDPQKNLALYVEMAYDYIEEVQEQVSEQVGLKKLILKLQVTRESVFNDEISQNPLGQILEPGFRVIFPIPQPHISSIKL